MCIKDTRIIINGNMIPINNEYYIHIDNDSNDCIFYKGTIVEVWKDIFKWNIRIFKNNKIYNTRKVNDHIIDMEKKRK